MGKTKESGSSTTTNVTNQTVTPQPTATETAMEQAQYKQFQQFEPGQTEMYQNAFNLGNQLLTSFGDKSGSMWQSLIGGVTPDQQKSMIMENQRMLDPYFQAQGLMDSGARYSSGLRAATDISNQNAQFNVGALQNALNLALSGQAQVQAPAMGATSQLASQLAGLRAVNTQGSGTQSMSQTKTSNPFLNSFYSSLGGGLGGLPSSFLSSKFGM
jgi:hypothetical protein